jgi:hypothetical protein
MAMIWSQINIGVNKESIKKGSGHLQIWDWMESRSNKIVGKVTR